MILRSFEITLSIFSINFLNFAHGCTVTNSPSTDQTVPTSIYADQDGSSIVYTVASSSPGTEYSTTGKSIQTLRNETQQCPKECTRRLNAFKDPNFGNVFLTRNGVTIAEGAPFGYTQQNGSSPIICAAKQGFCGANAPIYRFYKFSISGIVHAYAYSSNASLPGYAPEMEPLCYGWTNVEGNMTQKENGPLSSPVKRDELVTTCNSQLTVPNDKLLELKEYDNKKFGPMRDHYMTTLQQSQIGNDYQYVSTIGKVLREPSACGCTVELTQLVDSSGGIIGGPYRPQTGDKGREQNRIFESYVPIGETVFCARQKNACGATLPLYKHFQFLESDTRYTTTGRGPVFSYLYPETSLCYIWATNYTTSVTNNAPPFGSTPNTTVSMENTVTSTSKPITTVTTANTVTSAAEGMNRSAVPSTVTKTPTTVPTSVSTVTTVTTAAQGINRTAVPTTATKKPTTVVTSKGTVTTITKKATTNAVTEETIERKTIAPEQATPGTVTSNTVLMHTTKAMKNSSLSTKRPGSGESSEIGESTARSTVTSKVVSRKTTEKDESGESKTTATTNKPTVPKSSTVTTVSTKSSEGTTKTSTTPGTSTVSDRNVTSLGGQNQNSSVSVSSPTSSTSTTTTTKTTSTSSILTTPNTTRKEENNDKSTSTSGTKASTTSSLASLLTTVKNTKVTSPSPSSSTTKTTASATSSTTTRSGPESSTSQTNKTVTSSNSSTTMPTVSTTTTSKSSSISPTSRKTTTGVPTSTPAASTTSLKTTPMINQTATQKISGSSDTPISTLSTTTPVSSTPIPKLNGTVSLELPSNSTKGSDSLGAILKKFASILD